MITTIIKIHPHSKNKKEVLQTINSLTALTLKSEGCLRAEVCEDVNDKEILYLTAEWATEKDRGEYKKSKFMVVLFGLQYLLVESLQIIQSIGMDII
ncbi:hypothetical protein FCL47_03525 [Desulfopila sp. IMCC35006]|uniref:putative quinol monooxygenase n=1 Tax=Desulfopila sp. IMCC35006 TaxID=2569542 RepID=UPI0010AC2129|nr:antibiotic biosynthesis monooxygenase [Desulfopila sp. IMCC35006]TKB28564.1 hypothetical protein FCL47_03525 [Desulfopila sp. IMCC35006]